MKKVMIVGAGGVGRVVAHKCIQASDIFSEVSLVSRTVSKCEDIASSIPNADLKTGQVDADDVPQMVSVIKKFKPDLLINVALPYQDLHIMDACLETGTHYLDTANYEPPDEAKFEYRWQWAYQQKFKEKGLMALLGSGFDPGVTNVFTAYAVKHYFDEIHTLDIVDCNGGDHGRAFATNFNPEINIREITQKGKFYHLGKWVEREPHSLKLNLTYPEIGKRNSYLIYHEELESLVAHIPNIKTARFWMTFSEEYLTHLRVIQNIGMAGIKPVPYEGREIIPLQFLKAVLPDPGSLGENYQGETSIGCRIRGVKEGRTRTCYIYNNCSHQAAFQETGAQGVSYTTGVPATIGAILMATGKWSGQGVYNMEQFDPDPFMDELSHRGLIWHVVLDEDLEIPETAGLE